MRSPEKRKFKLTYFLMFSVFLFILIFILIDAQIRPMVHKVASYQGRIIATNIISSSVYSALNSDEFTYETLVKVTKNNIGNVSSIESNMAEINRLQAKITKNINDDFQNISKENITISTGTLSGINILYGRGPNLTFMLEPVGYVNSRLVSKFTPAGVNQTLHQIILEVNGNVSAVIPGFATNIDVNMNYLIAETVIVGEIPESYTYITGDDRTDVEKIMDNKK